MKFRPCIDIHNGKVKQIVGGSLKDEENQAKENYVSKCDASYYGKLYKEYGLKGGHIILLNPAGSEYYKEDMKQARLALEAYKKGLQIGGGINADNAKTFIDMGASHVIVTSYVFQNGLINYSNLKQLVNKVGKDKVVLDLSCRKRGDSYYIVTDRWQKFTEEKITESIIRQLSHYCDEFLIHAVDVEGKANGIECELVSFLGQFNMIPITYAGGVSSFEDLELLRELGKNHLDVTIGSALDLFGGTIKFQDVINICD